MERENMHCQDIACTKSFDMDLTLAEGLMLESFKLPTNNIFTSTMKF
jgi:hypothetical protein